MDTTSLWVAVVDDEEAIRRALLRLLNSAGVEARSFAGGADLIAALSGGLPYCVVLDLHMPDMDGYEVQARLAHMAPQVALVVMTGQHSAEAEARITRAGAATYLRKPMSDDILLAAIARAHGAWAGLPDAAAGAPSSPSPESP